MKREAPEAPVTYQDKAHVTVRCPYCTLRHTHDARAMRPGTRTRRAPGCGLHQSAQVRETGYWITFA